MQIFKLDMQELKTLHSSGLSNRKIAGKLGIHWSTVSKYLKKLGLKTNFEKIPIKMVGDNKAICSKCNKLLHIKNFSTNRNKKKYSYKVTYCNKCRYKQWRGNVKLEPFLKDKLSRCKTRCVKKNIDCNLDLDYLLNIFKLVKGRCIYLGYELDINNSNTRNTLSLDRVNCSEGYIKGNVIVCSNKGNSVKNDLTLEELKLHLPKWYKSAYDILNKWKEGDF